MAAAGGKSRCPRLRSAAKWTMRLPATARASGTNDSDATKDRAMTWNVRIGINPISWSNDDLPALGGETSLETALAEGAQIGYQGFELGNKFPQEPATLAAKLAEYGVACVSGWYSGHLAEGTLDAEVAHC